MKKTLILLISLLLAQFGFAQEGDIFYTDFEPDLCVKVVTTPTTPYPADTLKVDFDNDGTADFLVSIYMLSTGELIPEIHTTWDCLRYKQEENDTTVPSDTLWNNYHTGGPYMFYPLMATYRENLIGLKKTVDGVSYYAWLRLYAERIINGIGGIYDKVWVYIDKFAYCSIPDYPLQWGQTSLTMIEEAEEASFASIYPNPARNTVTITGGNIKKVEVINLFGEIVISENSDAAADITIDLSGQPTGVYFFNITNDNGEVHTKKVVKE